MSSVFAGHHSLALQQTMYAMGEAMIDEQPEIGEIRFSLPNKHHFVVDLSPFGLENPNEVFHADDRPYGFIEGTVHNDDAPAPGLALRPRSGLVVDDGRHRESQRQDGVALLPDGTPPRRRDAQARTDAPLRPAARDEHVRRRGRGAADRRQRAGLPFADLSYLLAADAAGVRPGHPAADPRASGWIGAKLPLVQGTSFAAVASMLAIGNAAGGGVRGLRAIFGAILIAGADRLPAVRRVRPPAALLPARRHRVGDHRHRHLAAAGGDALGGRRRGTAPTSASLSNIGLAAHHPGIILVIYRFLPGFFSRIAILVGLVAGGVVAAVVGKVDFSPGRQAQGFADLHPVPLRRADRSRSRRSSR